MKIVNLTPHKLNIYDENKRLVAEIEPSGQVARIATSRECVGQADGIPLFAVSYGEPEGLPKPQPDTIYVVSGMFRAAHDRADLYQPGELLRDENGRPVGCVGLSR